MTSPKQIAANRQNARRSTGPKTAKGKAVAKMNAVKHGILARHVVLNREDESTGAPAALAARGSDPGSDRYGD